MRLHTLKPAAGSLKSSKRIGRGQGSGKGGTATKGTKGAKARTGYNEKRGFEGGQMPLHRRLPKFGFVNPFRVEYNVFNLDMLEKYSNDFGTNEITPELFIEKKIISRNSPLVKILGNGEITKKLKITAHKFSESAKGAIEAAGGEAVVIVKNEKAN